MLFLNTHDEVVLRRFLGALGDRAVLSIGESEKFTKWGGIAALTARDDRIMIGINLDAATRAGLRIDARLLELASVTGK
jgi:hypothetical protein